MALRLPPAAGAPRAVLADAGIVARGGRRLAGRGGRATPQAAGVGAGADRRAGARADDYRRRVLRLQDEQLRRLDERPALVSVADAVAPAGGAAGGRRARRPPLGPR